MNWLAAILVGHLLNAFSYILDKVLLTKSIKNSYAFTFYVGLLGLLAVIFIPWGFTVPPTKLLLLDLVGGALFMIALLFFFLALSGKEASRIVPFIGGAIPVVTWIFELLFLEERLNTVQFSAFIILIIGTVLIAIDHKPKPSEASVRAAATKITRVNYKAWVYGLMAAIFFAISFGLTKIAFNTQPFFSAFIWMRFGSFLFPASFLLWPAHRKAIRVSLAIFKEKAGALYLLAQAFGAAGFIFINYAISLTAVSIVNALQGVQYAFLLIMAVIGTLKFPNLLKENMTKRGLVMKSIAVVVIGMGLYMIAQTGAA